MGASTDAGRVERAWPGKPSTERTCSDVLAELLFEFMKGDAARQRRVRMALSAAPSPQEAAAIVRKRFASIWWSGSFTACRTQKKFANELRDLISLIETRIRLAQKADGRVAEKSYNHALAAPGHFAPYHFGVYARRGDVIPCRLLEGTKV